MLLAIDTSAGSSVAIVDRERGTIVEHAVADTRRHAEVVGTLISLCLTESGVSVRALAAVAIGMGPGPFTGLRVGIAAAHGFALGARIPILRVGSHEAIAFAHYSQGAHATDPLLVVTDARRRELYWSAYSGAGVHGIPVREGRPGLSKPDELEATVTAQLGYETVDARMARLDAQWVSAASVGQLALRLEEHHEPFAEAAPLYLRAPDAVPSAGPKRVSA